MLAGIVVLPSTERPGRTRRSRRRQAQSLRPSTAEDRGAPTGQLAVGQESIDDPGSCRFSERRTAGRIGQELGERAGEGGQVGGIRKQDAGLTIDDLVGDPADGAGDDGVVA